jgi:hypothetical protein
MGRSPQTADAAATLSEFVYELLDAHEDTRRLAEGEPGDLQWEAHIDYLRRLQRVGREILASAGS